MKQEDIELLLKCLCEGLPYGLMVHLYDEKYGELFGTLDAVYPTERRVIVDELNKAIAPVNVRYGGFKLDENNVKPYLRTLSSMTEEEEDEFFQFEFTGNDKDIYGKLLNIPYANNVIAWLISHHFDYLGLISNGLAIEAPKDMYKNNN